MKKVTHICFAALLFSFFKQNLMLAWISFIACLFPDLDLGFKHRKLLHNLFALAAFCLAISFFSSSFFTPALIGYASHLILDSLTPSGIAIFWPLSKKRIRGPIKTGSLLEYIFLFLIICLFIYFLQK